MPLTRRPATFTSMPDSEPARLSCPNCASTLVYHHTVISGIKPVERWDYFDCGRCGSFVYRLRTRKLRAWA